MFAHSARKPSGVLIVNDPDCAREQHQDTLQCGHCGQHWVVQKGSGKKRGFCLRCMKPTCGSPRCDYCIPEEQQLELMERGVAWEDIPSTPLPVKVSMAGAAAPAASGLLGPDGKPLNKENSRATEPDPAADLKDLHPGQLPQPE